MSQGRDHHLSPWGQGNGGTFLHTNPWVIIAATLVGNGERAFDYYTQINPAAKNDEVDEHECEPYVYPQNILGDEHPRFGWARNSWLTGTAAWSYVALTQWILGIRPTYEGLRIAPVISPEWSGFKATRIFYGATYHITAKHVGEGRIVSITVDGQQIEGNVLPLPLEGVEDIEIEVRLR